MGTTFTEAQYVFSWLGEHDDKTKVYGAARALHSAIGKVSGEKIKRCCYTMIRPHLLQPYWSRMWVIQEVLFAKEVDILCEDHCIDEKDFFDMSRGCINVKTRYPGSSQDFGPVIAFLQDMNNRELTRAGGVIEIPLSQMVIQHWRSCATDSRDKIFALLGLLGGEQALAIRRYLPNYSLTYNEVIVIAVADIEEFEGNGTDARCIRPIRPIRLCRIRRTRRIRPIRGILGTA